MQLIPSLGIEEFLRTGKGGDADPPVFRFTVLGPAKPSSMRLTKDFSYLPTFLEFS